MANRNGKWWTPEEDAFLEEKVGKAKIETIAKKLGRSVIAVENRLDRLGVSNTKLESGKITAAELARYCGIDSHVVTRTWIPKKGLPAVRRVTRYKRKYWLIDVKEFWKWLVKYAREQAERVQELEEDLTKYRNGFEFQLLINNSIKKQNKRYREALELLVKQETLGKDAKTGKTAISYNGMIALKGLGIFNDDVYTVYGVDEVIESVLEDEE